MAGIGEEDAEVLQFILDKIDSVPHLEALLLLWRSQPKEWAPEELGSRLYVDIHESRDLLEDLRRSDLILLVTAPAGAYRYNAASEERNRLIALVDAVYRRRLIQVSTIIHSKAPSSVRDFARAFRFTKDRE